MTISSSVRIAGPYTGTGLVTVYSFAGLKAYDDTDVILIQTDTLGVNTTLTLNVDYTVALNGDQETSPGGNATLTTALTAGYLLTITTEIPATQVEDIENLGGFYPDIIEAAIDKLTILVQQVYTEFGYALRYPISDSASLTYTLPTSTLRANKALGFDASGNATLLDGITEYTSGFPDGSAAAPGIKFTTDSTTGVYRSATEFGLSYGGTKRLYWDVANTRNSSNGNFYTTGNLTATGTLTVNGAVFTSAGAAALTLPTGTKTLAATSDIPSAAAKADMETATSTTTYVSPGRVQNHPGVAKVTAYVAVSGGTPTLARSYGVMGITDAGAGVLDVTFLTTFSDTNLCAIGTISDPSGTPLLCSPSVRATGSIRFTSRHPSTLALTDPPDYSIAIFGDQ